MITLPELNYPFAYITEQTAIQRMLLMEGVTDIPAAVNNDGVAVRMFEAGDYFCLCLCVADKDRPPWYRLITCHKSAGWDVFLDVVDQIMIQLTFLIGRPTSVGQRLKVNNNN